MKKEEIKDENLSYWLFINKRKKLKQMDSPLTKVSAFFKKKKEVTEVTETEITIEVLSADVVLLKEQIMKKLKYDDEKMDALIVAKKEEFGNLINDSATIKIIGKELGLYKEVTNKDLNKPPEWLNVGKLDVSEGKIKPITGYEYLAELNLGRFMLSSIMKRDNEWSIIGSNVANRTEKGDGIFLRLSKSGKAFTFWIGERIFSISVQLFQENQSGEIPVSTPNKK